MLDIIRDLHLTVQNIVAGIALVSQNPGDDEFLRWEIKNGSNQPTVTISYKLPSELLQIANSAYKSTEIFKTNPDQENGFVNCLSFLDDREDRERLDSCSLVDEEERNSAHLSSDDEFNDLDSPLSSSENSESLANIFEPEICIQVQKDHSKDWTSSQQNIDENTSGLLTSDLHSKRWANSHNKKLLKGKHTSCSGQGKHSIKDNALGIDDHIHIKKQNSNCTKDINENNIDSIKTSDKSLRQFRLVLRNRNRVKHPIPETRQSLYRDIGPNSYGGKINELKKKEKHVLNERQCKIKKENFLKNNIELPSDNFSEESVPDCLDVDVFKPEIILKTKTLRTEKLSDCSKYLANRVEIDNENECDKFTYEPFPITFKELKKDFKTNLFTCNYCKKNFKLKTNLKVHMRIHTGEKPFPCSYCGKCFKDARDMKRHERIHTGERPYACRFCSKRFTRNHHRTGHERIHTGEKPYSCKYCGRKFSQIRSKNVHEKISCKKKTKYYDKEKTSV